MDKYKINVLLIEDDEDDYIITRDLLFDIDANKFDLHWVSSNNDALRIMCANAHDVILLDYTLKGANGLELFRDAKKGGCRKPVILMTGRIDREIDINAMKEGAADFLLKGQIDETLLDRSIRYAIRHSQMTEALLESEERYSLTVQGANDGLWDWNLQQNTIFYSSRWKSMLGFREEEIGKSPDEWFKRVHPDDLGRIKGAMEAHKNRDNPNLEEEYRIKNKEGKYLWVLVRGIVVHNVDGVPYRMAGSQTDITQRKKTEQQLMHDAFHDVLTNLPNRALFLDRMERLMARTQRHKEYKFGILFIDIDRFKFVNDSLGHTVGDQLLVKISRVLKKCIRTNDTVARMGGDEFTILVEDIDNVVEATALADRIHEELSTPFMLGEENIFITASIGIALYKPDYKKPDDLLRDADTAMYRAKVEGKARHKIFDNTMHTKVMKTLKLESDLRRAIQNEEFILYYQPIISLKDYKINRMEALLRWNHPQKGIMAPLDFIPLAEETGMILPIGELVVKMVCEQGEKWFKKFPDLRIAINFSARQFQQKGLCKLFKKHFQKSNIASPMIELEITESVAMHDIDYTISTLKDLRSMGILIAIDDFGIGYSSLSSLRYFPIDALKIDQSFIRNVHKNKNNAAITAAIISLGHNLDLNVVGEGVETQAELNFLHKMKCDEIQGFLFSKPVAIPDATELLSKSSPRLKYLQVNKRKI